jgi:hypothetical protein
MTRETLIDIIRRELTRQPHLKVQSADRPDDLRVNGVLDLVALANAIKDR